MTKKKNSRQKQKDVIADTSEEELHGTTFQGKACPHVARAVNFGRVKKVLKSGDIFTCSDCLGPVTDDEEEDREIWLCLQCGHRGCGQNSTEKHGLQHFKTIHSDCHSLVLSSETGDVWCYDCKQFVLLGQSTRLKQCVEFVLKLKTNNNKVADDKRVKATDSTVPKSSTEAAPEARTDSKSSDFEDVTKKNDRKNDPKRSKTSTTTPSIKGLKNLGNTCYFNAVMQNLCQTRLLRYALENSYSEHQWHAPKLVVEDGSIVEDKTAEHIKFTLCKASTFVHTFLQFLRTMSETSHRKGDVHNPDNLFSSLQRKAPHFEPHLQQDSQELLRQFLDGIKQEEIKRYRKPIQTYLQVSNDETKLLFRGYARRAPHTVVDQVFGGFLLGTVSCEECKQDSFVLEPFMDLSLPLCEEKQENSNHHYPLLDGGKQDKSKPPRHRNFDTDENEYVLNNSKKDYNKPSRHQEKKMKLQEKKEKKRNKKLLNKKASSISLTNDELGESQDGEAKPEEDNCPCEVSATADPKKDPPSCTVPLRLQVSLTGTALQGQEESSIGDEHSIDRLDTNGTSCSVPPDISPTVPLRSQMSLTGTRPRGQEVSSVASEHSIDRSDIDDIQAYVPLILFGEEVPLYEDMNSQKVSTVLKNGYSDFYDGNADDVLNPAEEKLFNESSINGEVEEFTEETDQTELDSSKTGLESETQDNTGASQHDLLGLDDSMDSLSREVSQLRMHDHSAESTLSRSSSANGGEGSKADCSSEDSSARTSSNEIAEGEFHDPFIKEMFAKSLIGLKPKKSIAPLECSIDSCLSHFTKPELLTGNNRFRCDHCSEAQRRKTGNKNAVSYCNARKQLMVFSPPAVLTLHLKRFQQVGTGLRKVNRFVEFPLTLDLSPYTCSTCVVLPHTESVKDEILYSLYGIVEHSGHLRSGHYTAYVKVCQNKADPTFLCLRPFLVDDVTIRTLAKLFRDYVPKHLAKERDLTPCEGRWFYVSDGHVRESSEAQVMKCQAYLLFYERIR